MENISKKLANLRNEYATSVLLEKDVLKNPILQFEKWFEEALKAQVLEANAFTLATVNKENQPSARIVLLKGISKGGFTFFTNYLSRKAQEIEANPKAAMVFLWAELERQVRIEGVIEKVTEEESNDYYHNRPMGSRLGAWASHQSSIIPNREILEQNMQALQEKYKGAEIEKPDFWGGYRVIPTKIEFWQGRPSRLHDRLQYSKIENEWKIERLSP